MRIRIRVAFWLFFSIVEAVAFNLSGGRSGQHSGVSDRQKPSAVTSQQRRPPWFALGELLLSIAQVAAFYHPNGGVVRRPGIQKTSGVAMQQKKKSSWSRPQISSQRNGPFQTRGLVQRFPDWGRAAKTWFIERLTPKWPTFPSPQEAKESVVDAVVRFKTGMAFEDARDDTINKVVTFKEEFRFRQVVAGFLLSTILSISALSYGSSAFFNFLNEEGRSEVVDRTFLFGSILENVRESYVEDNVDVDRLFQTGVNAMLKTLDPYSEYENAKSTEDLALSMQGRFGGVGLTITKEKTGKVEEILVIAALEGYAYDAGIRAGDKLIRIDDKPVAGMTTEQVKNKLRGDPGTKVSVVVSRFGSTEKELTFPLTRKLVQLRDVPLVTVFPGDVGYIKLDSFSDHTTNEVFSAIKDLQALNAQSLVLDMRDNPGGLLDAAIEVSQLLVPKDTKIVSTAGRVYTGTGSVEYRSANPPLLGANVPLVVLINGNTASAAEIVSGAVQDTDRGVIVGSKTFGKGLVQIVEPLPRGAALKLTVAKYYTPSGRCIQAIAYRDKDKKAPLVAVADTQSKDSANVNEKGTDQKDQQSNEVQRNADRPYIVPREEDEDEDTSPFLPVGRRSKPKRYKEEEMKTFYTKGGRLVKDGGGITPDVLVEQNKLSDFENILVQRGLFFSFTNEWLKTHSGTAEKQIQLLEANPDAVYQEFVNYVQREASQVKEGDLPLLESQAVDGLLDNLQKALATPEAGGSSRTLQEVKTLRKMLRQDQEAKFTTEKKIVRQDVTEAILTRLTAPSERLRAQVDVDPQVKVALDIARDQVKYKQILTAPSSSAPTTPTAPASPVLTKT